MSKKNKAELREQMHQLMRDYFAEEHATKKFVPGETLVPVSGKVYDDEEMVNLVDATLEFWLTSGQFTEKFEKSFGDFLKSRFVLTTNSGSSANLLAVSALTSPNLREKRLKPGDEVITVAASFPTTINPIVQNGLVPVFLDVELGTYNVNPDRLEEALSDKTRAIILAHTMGNPFDVKKVKAFAEAHNLFLIEDSCDALGSKFGDDYVGTLGDIGTFSFYPAHHITMGEGGALVTNNGTLKRIIESFRDWGRDCWCHTGKDNTCGKRFNWQLGDLPAGYDHKYIYTHIGYNLKVTDMQPAIGLAQLEKLPGFIDQRKENFKILYEGLSAYEEHLILPQATPGSDPSWFGFLITVKEMAPFTKNDLVHYLEDHKIATRMLFAGNITKHPAYRDVPFRTVGSLENSDTIMNQTFWIGLYPGLNREMLDYTSQIFKDFFQKHAEI